jgi:DNA-binding NarL/FixJ family response regulator
MAKRPAIGAARGPPPGIRQNDRGMATTVLIVDDHAPFRASARMLLEAEGFEVVGEATDGGSAVEQAAALSPDLVLLDVHLPDIDGFEVVTRVIDADPAAAVILISSRESADLEPRLQASGARGFVSKADLSGDGLRALLDG